jgi:hypothetical protein
MEFDLEGFMSEITTAFESNPEPSRTSRTLDDNNTAEDEETGDPETDNSSPVESTSLTRKRRRLSTRPHVAVDTSQYVASRAIPSFFHPSIYL